MKTIKIYRIADNYRSCMVWEGSRMTGSCTCQHKLSVDKGLARQRRYEEIRQWLPQFGFISPIFKEKRTRR